MPPLVSWFDKSLAYRHYNCLQPFSLGLKLVVIQNLFLKKNSSYIKMAGSIANVMLTQNDEVDSLSDLTQICLEIKSQVSAIYRFICPKRPNCLKKLKNLPKMFNYSAMWERFLGFLFLFMQYSVQKCFLLIGDPTALRIHAQQAPQLEQIPNKKNESSFP